MNRFLTIFGLIYWGLLVNLGPSVHTLSVFGLHQNGGNGAPCCHSDLDFALQNRSVITDDCCGHGRHTNLSQPEGRYGSLWMGPELSASDLLADHDCYFCDFFDYLSATATESTTWIASTSITSLSETATSFPTADRVNANARGPPA